MSDILLKNRKLIIEKIDISNILEKLYYDLYILPTLSEIEVYNNKNSTNYQLDKIIEIISNIETDIPLFDITTQNIYLIPANQVYYYVNEKYYRLLNDKILKLLENAYQKTDIPKLKNRLEKNINFSKNYNYDILFNTYLRVIYTNSNQIGKNITYCRRLTYLPYLTMSPYYSRSEIINMALNLKLIKSDSTYYDNEKLDKLCLNLISNDITSEILLKHQIYIEKNNAQHIIYYYTFYGSLYYNNYIRQDTVYDKYIDTNIKQLFALVKKSPVFDNDYYVYRFITNDDYLQHVQINGIYTENSFISTSRNPFYEPKNHVFGYILLKIKLPKKKEGIGLCLETYSFFPKEEEILLAPGKLKLISVDDDFKYYHHDIIAQQNIKKKYEFEYIESLDEIPAKKDYNSSNTIFELPENFSLISTETNEKLMEFYRTVPLINDMRYLKLDKYTFQVFYLHKVLAYYKYYFLLNNLETTDTDDIIFLVLQDPKTQEINVMIEISTVISVNYLHKFTGAETIQDKELIKIISDISELFHINTTIIHPIYKKYVNKITKFPTIELNEYNDEDEIMKLSADLNTYNDDIWNYLLTGKNERFINMNIVNKMNLFSLDRLKRLPLDIILKKEDTDILYKLAKKGYPNIYKFLLFLHENYFYLVPVLIKKILKVTKYNPFDIGYYIYLNDNYSFNSTVVKNDIDNIQNILDEKLKNEYTIEKTRN